MRIPTSQLSEHSSWWLDSTENEQKLPQKLSSWLLNKGSLTAALMTLSDGDFKVEVVWQGVAVAHPHEQQKLGIEKTQKTLIREVELNIFGQPVVFARSIIPLDFAGSEQSSLENLGSKPLGHLLFKDGNIRVSKREFAKIGVDKEVIHARRTPYDYENKQILVSEFFLPSFCQYL